MAVYQSCKPSGVEKLEMFNLNLGIVGRSSFTNILDVSLSIVAGNNARSTHWRIKSECTSAEHG